MPFRKLDISVAILPFVNGCCHFEQQSFEFCRFHEEDKVLIAEIQLLNSINPDPNPNSNPNLN